MASHVVENKSTFYGYKKKAEMEANIAEWKHEVPELYYVFGPQGSWNLLEVMKKKHLYLKAVDAYSLAVLVRQIWKKEWDKKLLSKAMLFHGFELKLKLKVFQD
jgi:hypothetical protein